MPELQIDVTVANRFISSLSKSLQALCHGCMEFDSGIEIVGYININIDSGSKVDYVLNEKVLKSTTNSMTFVSNSFLAKKDAPKQNRDEACSPIPQSAVMSPYPSRLPGAQYGAQYHRSASQYSPHSQVMRGPQKRSYPEDWRSASKRHRIQNKGPADRHPAAISSGQSLSQSYPSPVNLYPDVNPKQSEVNIKKEALEGDDHGVLGEQSTSEQFDEEAQEESHDQENSAFVKRDPDAAGLDTSEANLANSADNENTDFKGTFLDPSLSHEASDENNTQSELDCRVSFDPSLEGTSKEQPAADEEEGGSPAGDDGKDPHDKTTDSHTGPNPADFDHSGDTETYSNPGFEEAGEGSSNAAGNFEVIEIGDEDEDVQAMFGDSQWSINSCSSARLGKTQKGRHHSGGHSISIPDHLLTASAIQQSQEESMAYSQIEGDDGTVLYTCNICGQVVNSTFMLQKHMNMLHKDVGALPFCCPICQQGFFSYSGMWTHKLTHSMGRQFSCQICSYRFLYKHHLKRHEASVHKLARCSICLQLVDLSQFSVHRIQCSVSAYGPRDTSV